MNVLIHFPNFLLPSEVLLYAVNYLLKAAFSKLGFSHTQKIILHFNSHFINLFCVLFFTFIFNGTRNMKHGRKWKFHFAGIYLLSLFKV